MSRWAGKKRLGIEWLGWGKPGWVEGSGGGLGRESWDCGWDQKGFCGGGGESIPSAYRLSKWLKSKRLNSRLSSA